MSKRNDITWARQNSLCWILKQEHYMPGVVIQVNPLIVNTIDGNVNDPKNILQRSEDNYLEIDNLIDLTVLNEAELLNAIITRYEHNKCQTICGPTFLNVNPIMKDKAKQQHLSDFVMSIYHSITERSQSIIMIGEQGSGKTETDRLCQQYLGKYGNIVFKLQQANHLLQTFGNARTLRNPNSSRFGQMLTLHFDKEQKLQGARITSAAFEKSRINSQPHSEQNFHIFYKFLQYSQLNLYSIDPKQPITILSGFTGNYESHNKYSLKQQQSPIDGTSFAETLEALKTFNINIEAVLNIIASIIKLGNIQFDDRDAQCTIIDQKSILAISQMLGIAEKELMRCLCSKTRQVVKNEINDIPLSRIECINQQQNIIKQLYERLFQYMIDSINISLQSKVQTQSQINLVDILGFEAGPVNSFEHLIINYTHEKLHQLYIAEIFSKEAVIYTQEGLAKNQVVFPYTNNQSILDCLDKPPLGILNILDDSCAVAGTDETFLAKVKNAYVNQQFVTFSKQNQPNFKIKHSPQEVEYNVIGFRIKNKDENNKQFQVLLSKSKNSTISTIFTQGLQNKYIGTVVRADISEIINILKESDNHFIRCIKPNDQLIPEQINSSLILHQIKYMGILESIKVRKEGYAIRKTYKQIYQQLTDTTSQIKNKNDLKQAVQSLLQKKYAFADEQVLYGNNIIFFKQQAYYVIEQEIGQLNEKKNSAAAKLQNAWICYKNSMIFRDFLYRVKFIQAHIRGYLDRKKYLQKLQSIVFIQFQIRQILKKQQYLKFVNTAKVVQTYFKRLFAIKYMIVEEQAVIKIQRFMRLQFLHREKAMVNEIKKIVLKITDRTWKVIVYRAATKIQKVWKGYITRRKYEEYIESIKLASFMVSADRAAATIQKYVKRNQMRVHYLQMRSAAVYIQGWIRSRWLKNLFDRIRLAAIVIQRGVRKYFNKYRQQKKQESKILHPLENELNRIKEQEFMNLHDNFIEQLLDVEQENTPGKKIDLFSQVIDLEILSDVSEVYDTLWTSLYKRCFKDCYEKQNNISTISIGECHAYTGTLLNKVYSWGMNDQLQQGLLKQNPNKINQIQFQFKVKTIKSGANHGLMLSYDNILYSTDDKQPLLKDVKLFGTYNDDNVAVDENNLIYIWKKKHKKPLELKSWTSFIRISQLQQKISVHQISHGLQFIVVLSTNGLMFSMGENSVGELGINWEHSRNELTLIELQDKIAEIHCGMKHTIAKSTLGKVYTWGWGQMGQLGQNSLKDEPFPKLISLEGKALQVMAGHKQSIVILETRKVFWWGTNSCLSYQSRPVEYMINYPAVRALCSWSRTLSIVYITFAKTFKSIDSNVKLKHKIINSLVSKWSDSDVFSIDPPYCESLANYFNQMKKPQLKTNIKFASKIEHQQLVKQLQQSPFNLLDDIKDTNCFFSFKNESNILQTKQLQQHSENTGVLNHKNSLTDNSDKLKLLKLVKKYKNDPQLKEILKQSELSEILQYIN